MKRPIVLIFAGLLAAPLNGITYLVVAYILPVFPLAGVVDVAAATLVVAVFAGGAAIFVLPLDADRSMRANVLMAAMFFAIGTFAANMALLIANSTGQPVGGDQRFFAQFLLAHWAGISVLGAAFIAAVGYLKHRRRMRVASQENRT